MTRSAVQERNIRIFADTRKRSKSRYLQDTERMICDVKVYSEPADLRVPARDILPKVSFVSEGTVAAAFHSRESDYDTKKICMLNFADALTPGGLVEIGEVTQEECLCRCSNLYESLILSRCMSQYYKYNQDFGNHLYSDRLIYSPGVLFFKHDTTYSQMQHPFKADVITCPAPSTHCNIDILIYRIKGILRAAGANGVETIVLGAWGCGAFGQDASVVGKAFGIALQECNYFSEVIFAIIEVVKSTDAGNMELFIEGFSKVYKQDYTVRYQV